MHSSFYMVNGVIFGFILVNILLFIKSNQYFIISQSSKRHPFALLLSLF